jgi:hypothetical protein
MGGHNVRPAAGACSGSGRDIWVESWLVTTPRGVLLGLLARDDAEGALKEMEAKTKGSER